MKSNKIISRIFGGLGNQLFCYAAARRLALVTNSELLIDDFSGFVYDDDYKRRFQLEHFSIPCQKAPGVGRVGPLFRLLRYLKRIWNRRLPFVQRSYIQQEGVDFDPRLLKVIPKGTVYLEGYWQSEGYFKDEEAVIRNDLQIKPPIDETNLTFAVKIQSCTAVGVHVRFFDMPSTANTNNAPDDYYRNAIARMELLAPKAHYFIFSDKPNDARARIPLSDDRITMMSHNFGDENAYADLWLMTMCQHFIIANSTFSWWGAWLANQPGKQVIAPAFKSKQGKMDWGFEGLLPEDWIKL